MFSPVTGLIYILVTVRLQELIVFPSLQATILLYVHRFIIMTPLFKAILTWKQRSKLNETTCQFHWIPLQINFTLKVAVLVLKQAANCNLADILRIC